MVINPELAKDVLIDSAALERLELRDGDIVAIRVSGSNERAGICAVCSEQHNGMVNDDNTLRMRLISSSNPLFYAYLLNMGSYRAEMKSRLKVTSGQYSIDQQSMGSIVVPTPDRKLQDAFAECLAQQNDVQSELNQRIESLSIERDALLDRFIDV